MTQKPTPENAPDAGTPPGGNGPAAEPGPGIEDKLARLERIVRSMGQDSVELLRRLQGIEKSIEGSEEHYAGSLRELEARVREELQWQIHKGCLLAVMPGLDDAQLPTCETRGVLGTTAGTIGALEATEAIKLLAGIPPLLEGKLLICDLREMDFRIVDIQTRPDCRVCQVKEPSAVLGPEKLTWLCGQSTVNVNPATSMRIDLRSVTRKLGKRSKIHLRTPLAVVFEFDGYEVSLFSHGRMLIKGVKSERKALDLYGKVLDRLGVRKRN